MPSRVNLVLYQVNTEEFTVAVTLDGSAYDLTGATVEVYIKPTAATSDTDLSVSKLTIGGGITVLDVPGGRVRVTVPSGVLTDPGLHWYRVDVVAALARRTAVLGTLYVTDV